MSDKEQPPTTKEKLRTPKLLRNTAAAVSFTALTVLGIAIGAEISDTSNNTDTAFETAMEYGKMALPIGTLAVIGAHAGLMMMADNEVGPGRSKSSDQSAGDKLPQPAPTDQPLQTETSGE